MIKRHNLTINLNILKAIGALNDPKEFIERLQSPPLASGDGDVRNSDETDSRDDERMELEKEEPPPSVDDIRWERRRD